MRGLTDMKNGAVSVAPRPVSIGTRKPVLLHRQFVEAVPDKRRQRRAGEEHRVQPVEEFCAQRLVVAQIRQQRFIALRHVEIDRRRNLAEIAHGLLDAAGHRLALVEIHRAAVEQRQPDIVVAAKGVIPRQPVDDHRRLVLQEGQRLAQHHLVGADHALGVDDGLGIAGRARGQQEFRDGVGADRVVRRIEAADAAASPCRSASMVTSRPGTAPRRRRSRCRREHWPPARRRICRRRRQRPGPASAASSGKRACRNPSRSANRPATPDRTECRHSSAPNATSAWSIELPERMTTGRSAERPRASSAEAMCRLAASNSA